MSVSLDFGLLTLSYSDNLPYAFCEQIGKDIRDISDEIPFEIPESWEWCRLGTVFHLIMGQSPKGDEVFEGKNGIEFHQGKIYFGKRNIDISNQSTNKPTKIAPANSVLLCVRAPVGKVNIANREICIGRGLCAVIPLDKISVDFTFFWLLTLENEFVKKATGTTFTAITGEIVNNQLIPLPPIEEQHRIVAKIEELLPYIEEYDKAETRLTALNETFPEMLKKSILQEAVQGKLVPQNPDDEHASVLLERIRAEKQALIKAGKIKRDKHESVIVTRDKIPYEIPDSWEWCKLSDLAILENGDRSSKYPVEADYVESGIPFFGAKDIDGEMMSFQNVRFISQQKYDELGNGKLVDGDIICLLRGSVGKTTKFEANEQFNTGFICAQMLIIRLLDKSLFGYISSYFKSPDYTNYVESKVTGTAVRQMPAKEMGNLLIPLPPLNEQHRIVSKIEEIMPYINTITK